jgi:serine phosphatase RsbU (regulator of sigma subunit)/anti-sigma regulatory factor (Ser/Thr protein kinase)
MIAAMAQESSPLRGEPAMALAQLQQVTDSALAYLSLEDLLNELLQRVTAILSSDTAAILLLDEEGTTLVARAAKGIEEEVERGVRIPVGKGFAGRIVADRRPIAIEDVSRADILNPILREKGIRSLLGVPLLVEGRVLGVLHVGTLTPRHFVADDEELLQLVADRAAIAIEHNQLYEQRRLTQALQRSLLPERLPELPGLEIAARYVPAAIGSGIGGDWYDVFGLAGGRIGLAIGDVVGRGPGAAALMAQLRTGLRAYAVDEQDPAAVVERLDRLLRHLRPARRMATLAYAVLDPAAESLDLVSAGHPPPLLLDADGTARYALLEGGPPLGAARAARFSPERLPLPVGSTVLLFTDGAVEVRGEPLEDGLERLRGLAEGGGPATTLCDAVVARAAVNGQPADDLAVLVVRTLPLGDRLMTRWPADAEVLSSVRHLLRRWLRRYGASEDEIYDIMVACQEACANAVEHAYAPGGAAFEVEAQHSGGQIELVVRDRGQWRPARGDHRGRGLPLMEALMDEVEVVQAPEGTSIVLRRMLAEERAA